jgi:hypothetical protein
LGSLGSPPTVSPTVAPTIRPSIQPTLSPTCSPTVSPSVAPSIPPSVAPSISPSIAPSVRPTVGPSVSPTINPSLIPSVGPTVIPSVAPSYSPYGYAVGSAWPRFHGTDNNATGRSGYVGPVNGVSLLWRYQTGNLCNHVRYNITYIYIFVVSFEYCDMLLRRLQYWIVS